MSFNEVARTNATPPPLPEGRTTNSCTIPAQKPVVIKPEAATPTIKPETPVLPTKPKAPMLPIKPKMITAEEAAATSKTAVDAAEETLGAQIADLKQQLAAKDIERTQLQEALAGEADQVARLQQQVVAKNHKLAKSKQQLEAKEDHIVSLKEQLAAKEDERAGLKQQLGAEFKKNAGLKEQLSTTLWLAVAVVCVLAFSVRNPVCKQEERCPKRKAITRGLLAHSSNSHTDTLVHLQAGLVIMWQALKLSNAWDTIDDYYRRIGWRWPSNGSATPWRGSRPSCTGRSRGRNHPSRAAHPSFDV